MIRSTIKKTQSRPRSVRFGRFRRWRYDIVYYKMVEGKWPGVYDTMLHQGHDSGYVILRRTAVKRVGKKIGE